MPSLSKLRTLWRLGPANLARVGLYRTLLRSGHYRRLLPIQPTLIGPFFDWTAVTGGPNFPAAADAVDWARLASRIAAGELPTFSNRWAETGFPPRWHRSVITQVNLEPAQVQVHWTRITDFALAGGDIKGYWEPARFDGLLILGLGWLCTRSEHLRLAIESWLTSWCAQNPMNSGVQWKCGQETAIRLMQGLLVVQLLARWGGVTPTSAFARWVEQHCARIAPTMLYAVGQDNNHGTSEAVALFTAGAFLASGPPPALAAAGRRWRDMGRRWLEDRLARLVMRDGSFSQHSVNYHRLLLDTCSFAETTRRLYGEPAFSDRALHRCRAATEWLSALTDRGSGDAPNLGANDGARLFVLHRAPFRDFRPSVQWATRLFLDRSAYAVGAHDEALRWLGLPVVDDSAPPPIVAELSRLWPDGGLIKLVAPRAWVLFRLPRYRFRPSHCDGQHLDLWLGGRAALCDGGSFSYNSDDHWLRYFTGTESHNTVQFDGRDQMPRLSRFLFSDWLETEAGRFDAEAAMASAAYRDTSGAWHQRSVTLQPGRCTVVDRISGVRHSAVLRWRIAPHVAVDCSLRDGVWSSAALRIEVRATSPMARFECVEGWESRHYADKSSLTVLEAEVRADTTFTTEITWPV